MKKQGMFIYDEELRERFAAEADAIIARLDQEWSTQKSLATRPEGARYRPAVENSLKAMGK